MASKRQKQPAVVPEEDSRRQTCSFPAHKAHGAAAVGKKEKNTQPPVASASSGGGGWLTAAASSGRLGLSAEDSPDATTAGRLQKRPSSASSSLSNTAVPGGSAATPGGWLASSVACGNLGGFGDDDDDDETRDVIGGGANKEPDMTTEDTATQTDDVTITAAITVGGQETSEKPKSKLPPWAKPWKPHTTPSTAVADPTPSTASVDEHQTQSVAKDRPSAGGPSSETGGGLDWINATANGKSRNIRSVVARNGRTNQRSQDINNFGLVRQRRCRPFPKHPPDFLPKRLSVKEAPVAV